MPMDKSDLSYVRKARERLIFDEFYAHHLKLDKFKRAVKKKVGFEVQGNKALVKNLINKLPFKLTEDQFKALSEIIDDIRSETKMNRLLQGDIGCGKTIVVLLAAPMFVVSAGYQVAIMAPTEVLAMQHMKSLHELFSTHEISELSPLY